MPYPNDPLSFQARCLRLSALVIRTTLSLPKDAATKTIVDQLLRSATSVGANANEARSAESRADFIHKMSVSLKEARETSYWLSLLKELGYDTKGNIAAQMSECSELVAIMVASVKTAKRNMENQQK
jgi:four helix bundle protein